MTSPPPTIDDPGASVAAVPGVVELYPAHPGAIGAARRVVGAVIPVDEHGRVAVDVSDGHTAVSVRLGVSAASETPRVAREVADVLLTHHDAPDTTIDVQIARIH